MPIPPDPAQQAQLTRQQAAPDTQLGIPNMGQSLLQPLIEPATITRAIWLASSSRVPGCQWDRASDKTPSFNGLPSHGSSPMAGYATLRRNW